MRGTDFDRLFGQHAQHLFTFLVYRTGDRGLAEDLLADTFEAAFRGRGHFDRSRGSERTWLTTIALNCLRDHARRRGAEARAYERAGSAGDTAGYDRGTESVADRELLMRGLASLSDKERETVALRFGADLTVKQIAAALGEPETTIDGRVYRALRKLRAELS